MYMLNLSDAFAELIKKSGWYRNSGVDRRNANRDKRNFLSGRKIPEDRMRIYLRAAQWVQCSEEKWQANYKNQTDE